MSNLTIKSFFQTTHDTEDEKTEEASFDPQAGATWIYPTNYPPRDYQFNIIKEALFQNVLVSLPTGLGKTFIAAVIMYNFYRWYPTGKVIFIAPTRPLVKQQVEACYNIMAIPKDVTAELTGSKQQISRNQIWTDKRVFFVTPQVLQNDLDTFPALGRDIRCLVFDEAHKARGNHAYCEVIRKIFPMHRFFRVLALSATPGSSLNDVSEVIKNLLISHVEFRTDDSPDVTPYVHQRSLETIVVPLDGKLQQVRDDYIQILEQYTRVLIRHKVITGNCSMLTKGRIFMTMKDFQEKGKQNRNYSEIMRNLNICVTLYHAYELLIRHGLRGFLSFYEEHASKPLLRGNISLQDIMKDVGNYLGPIPNIEPLPDGSIPDVPASTKFGHPKFYKLKEILMDHFKSADEASSRVIVFFEYRESVMEAYTLLLSQKPLIRARIFLGQGAISQRQQINVITAFRNGECNTLLSTCIGEEGLDVGDVNLIVCFDISNKSPVRMVQRMGRTGRKGKGRVVILVTEGKEQQTLQDCLQSKNYMSKNIITAMDFNKHVFVKSPRMIPKSISPACVKMHITVTNENSSDSKTKSKKGKGANTIKSMFSRLNSGSTSSPTQEFNDIEIENMVDRIPEIDLMWNKSLDDKDFQITKNVYHKNIEKLKSFQTTGNITHSLQTEILVSLLEFADSKRYNIPTTQTQVTSRLVQSGNSKKTKISRTDSFKQSDIRTMFGITKKGDDEAVTDDFQTQLPIVLSPVKEEHSFDKDIFNELHREITNYLTIKSSESVDCAICKNLFVCFEINNNNQTRLTKEWIQPDFSIVENVKEDDLDVFIQTLQLKETNRRHVEDILLNETTSLNLSLLDSSVDLNQRVEYLQSPLIDKTSIPKNYKTEILENKTQNNKIEIQLNNKKQTQLNANQIPLNNTSSLSPSMNLDYSPRNIRLNNEDTLASDKKFETEKNEKMNCLNTKSGNEETDIFSPSTNESISYSPDIFDSDSPKRTKTCDENDNSPILCTYDRISKFKTKVKKKLFNTSNNSHGSASVQNTSCESDDVKSPILNKLSPILHKPVISKLDQAICNLGKNIPVKLEERDLDKSVVTNWVKTNTKIPSSQIIEDKDIFENILSSAKSKKPKLSIIQNSKKIQTKSPLSLSKIVPILEDDDLFEEDFLGIKSYFQEANKSILQTIDGVGGSTSSEKDKKKSPNLSKLGKKYENGIVEEKPKNYKNETGAEKLPNLQKEDTFDSAFLEEFSLNELSQQIRDVCDLSMFNLDDVFKKPSTLTESNDKSVSLINGLNSCNIDLDIESSVDLSTFGFSTSPTLGSGCRKINGFTRPTGQKHQLSLSKQSTMFNQHSLSNKSNVSKKSSQSQVSVTQALEIIEKENNRNLTKIGETQNITCSNSASQNISSQTNRNILVNNRRNYLKTNPQTINDDISQQSKNIITRSQNRSQKFTPITCANPIQKKSQIIFKKPLNIAKPTDKINTTINLDESDDDDFEVTLDKNSRWITKKTKPDKSKDNKQGLICHRKKKKLKECGFLDMEAKLSDTESRNSSDEDDDSENDLLEASFVDDDGTQEVFNNTEMHAHYLQSVKSPHLNKGKFKIPKKPYPDINVFSQEVQQEDNSYLNDTFCVDSETIELTQAELCPLEVAEMILKDERKKKRRRKEEGAGQSSKVKRRRVMQIVSDDESD